jgi:photosystem II stability/assembly factor-like uncharacterized protein
MRRQHPLVLTLALALLLPTAAAEAAQSRSARRAAAEAPLAAAGPDDLALRALGYRLVGPFRGGRVTAVAGVRGEPGTYYMGATGGGVWKTTDYGETWHNVSDLERPDPDAEAPRPMGAEAGGARPAPAALAEGEGVVEPGGTVVDAGAPPKPRKVRRGGDAFGSASVGAVAVAPSDPNVVWVGMGSACIRGNTSAGDGVYRSTDAGRSWYHVGLPEAGQIGRIAVHPTDPDTAWVAALGHAFGPNRERGVYRTRDGGRSWENVLWVSDEAGAVDLALDPSNPRIVYATTWQAVRKPWDMISGGPGSGLFRSLDGGDTWVELTEGLPEGIKGRMAVAVSPARPGRVWTLVEHAEEPGLYRSDDGGASFRLVSSDANLTQRPWYYMHVYADPQDAETVWVLNVLMWRSTDGGKSFVPVRTPHGDNHDLWIDPDDPRIMVQGNDGGANVTTNGGRTWSTQANQPTAEMYRVAVDEQHPYWLYGGQQDNSTVAIPSRSDERGISRHHWYAPGGCESGWVAVDPRDPDVTWAGCYGGAIERFDHATGHAEQVMAWPQLAVGQPARDLDFRFQWNAPIRVSRHDPSVLLHASNHVHRSTDGGRSWQLTSPDLTRDDESKQGSAGGPISKDNTGVEVYGTIFALEESPVRAGLWWAGSDDGRVHVSEDGGESWREVTPAALPEWGTVNAIEPSPHDPARAFLAVHRYRMDDFRPWVFRTDDLGASWTSLADGANGIPAGHPVRVVREDPERRGLLYAGTEYGLYASFDDGATWRPLQLDLPVTPVTDLAVHRGDLVVATQGRSYWILDDLAPLRQWTPQVSAAPAHLYAPEDVVLYPGAGGGGQGEGENPPRGAVVHYHLDADLSGDGAEEVTIEVLDAAGEVLRTLSSQEEEPAAPNPFLRYFPEFATPRKLDAERGLNRWVWDLRLPDAELVDDAVLWGNAAGPEVPPGEYRLRLTRGAEAREATFQVLADPRLDVSPEDAAERFRLSRQVHGAVSRAHRALRALRDVRGQVADFTARLDPDDEDEALRAAADAVRERLDGIERRLTQPKAKAVQDVLNHPPQLDNQLLYLYGNVETAEGRPTAGAYERFEQLSGQLDALLAELDAALAAELAAFNQAAAGADAPRVVVGDADWR